jgi:hypothetical protein
MFVKKVISSVIILLAFIQTYGQGYIPDDTRTLFIKEFSGGGFIHNNGWGLIARYTKYSIKDVKVNYEFNFARLKHPREVKIVNPIVQNAKSYVFARLNTFYVVRIGVGSDKLLFDKSFKDGVEVRGNFLVGHTAGLAKPNYIQYWGPDKNPLFDQPDVVKYNPGIHNPFDILGSAGFSNGLNETTYHPGVFVKAGLHFDWSKSDERIKALEVGTTMDLFADKVPIMADEICNNAGNCISTNANKQLFLTFYANILLGKKW